MNFQDQGIIIAKKAFAESGLIITVFTENHGLYAGMVKTRSKKDQISICEGNLVDFIWHARLHEHLGFAKCELKKSFNGYIIADKHKLYAFNSIVALIKKAFCEREPHNNFFPKFIAYLASLKNGFKFKDYIELEINLLAEAGYKLSLQSCISCGSAENLVYVSPKSGGAVCYNSGKPFEDKLLPLPQFLINNLNSEPEAEEIKSAFNLTTYFLSRYITSANQITQREDLKNLLERA